MYRKGGIAVLLTLVVALGAGLVVLSVPQEVVALTDEERAQRDAEREARRAERAAERAQRKAEREARRAAREAEKQAEEEAETAQCGCRASLKFSDADIRFNGARQLMFIPRVDLKIRTDGEPGGPNWSASVVYEGDTSYASEDVDVPGGVSFSGQKEVLSGQCGDNNYNFKGIDLTPVTLSGLVRSLVGLDQELEGQVRMQARVEGCGFEEEHEAARFEMSEFGGLKVRGWRSVR